MPLWRCNVPNPYYIPRPKNSLADITGQALQLYGLKQHGEIAERQAGLTEKEQLLRGETNLLAKRKFEAEYGTPERMEALSAEGPTLIPATEGTEQAKIRLLGEHGDIEKRKQEMAEKENVDINNFEPIKAMRVVRMLQSLGLPKDHPLGKRIIELANDKNITNADAYDEIKNLYPQFRAEIIEKVTNDFLKKDEENVLYHKSPEGQAQQQFVNALAKDDTGDTIIGGVFARTIEARQRRQATATTAQAHLAQAMRPEKPGSDIGKLQEDRKRYLAEGYKEDSTLIKAIDSEIKKKSEVAPAKVQSMGNAVDLAINRKFKDPAYLTDANKQMEALTWLGTPEGKKGVQEAALDVTPPQITYLQTSEGLIPAGTKGPGAGMVGQPTGLGKPLSSEQASKIGELNTLLSNLETIKGLYKPEWVGPVAGRVGGLQEKYTGGASEDQVKFYAYVRDVKDALLRARSGAQINEQEYARLVKFLPDETSPAKTFEARVERFKESVQTILTSKKQALGEAGYGTKSKPDSLGIR